MKIYKLELAALDWVKDNGYDYADAVIHEYEEEDMEDYSFVM